MFLRFFRGRRINGRSCPRRFSGRISPSCKVIVTQSTSHPGSPEPGAHRPTAKWDVSIAPCSTNGLALHQPYTSGKPAPNRIHRLERLVQLPPRHTAFHGTTPANNIPIRNN